MMKYSSLRTYTALFLAVLFWGLSFIGTKIALQSFSTFTLIFLRFFGGSIFFALFFLKVKLTPIKRKDIIHLVLLAIMQPGLYFTFETLGLQYTSATKTSLIIATIPVFVLGFSAFFLKEKISLINFSGILLSLFGVTLLVFGDNSRVEMEGVLLGDILIFGAVISAAIYMILTRRLGGTMPAHQITGFQVILGAFLFFPAFLYELPQMSWGSISKESLIALIGLTIFATIGAFLCYNYALTQISAARASVCINGIPLVTAVSAWLILGELLTPLQFAGGAIIVLALFLVNRKQKESEDNPIIQASITEKATTPH